VTAVSDLFALVSSLAEATLVARSASGPAEPAMPLLPPGIPALPPDPRLISAAIDAIRAHDPAFDEAGVLERARAVWHLVLRARTEHRPELCRGAVAEGLLGRLVAATGEGAALRDAVISAATAGPSLESITVRLGIEGAIRRDGAWEEDWVFQRFATATTAHDPLGPGHCPTCGAPLEIDASGTCSYCHASVLAAAGWVLVTRNRLRPMTGRDTAILAMVATSGGVAPPAVPAPPPPAAAEGVDVSVLGTDAYSLLATARETVYAVAQARSQRRPELVAGRVSGELADALRAEAAETTARHRHHVLAFLEVGGAVIVAAAHDGAGDSLTVRLQLSGQEYELADGSLEVVDGTQTMRSWSEDWVFVRAASSDTWRAASSKRATT
jgi:predicted lipid-binding transport protein (Tim44 family)